MIPSYVKPFLWSYDTKAISPEKDKRTIILNVLNLGTKEATDWLFGNYSFKEIKEAIRSTYKGEWGEKSLNFWRMVLKANPKKKRNVALRNLG